MATTTLATTTTTIEDAARTYLSRKDRTSHPDGTFDKGSRWYASTGETRPCCATIRYPSRSWPYSQMVHSRTAEHVAQLYGVSATELRREARRQRQEEER